MIELSISEKSLQRIKILLEELSPKNRDGAIRKGILKASSTVLARLVQNVSGDILHRRTGNLAKSMGFRLEQDKDGNLFSTIGSGASLKTQRMIYANIHETGGIIRPVVAKMLAIPIGEALTPAGVPRFKPRQITQNGYRTSFIRRTKAGNLVLFGGLGRDKPAVPLFVLKNQVIIPARRYMTRTVEQTKDDAVEDIVTAIRDAKEKQ